MATAVPTASRCCVLWDLRRGVMAFSAFQAVLSPLRFAAAVITTWDRGSDAYLILMLGAVLFGLAGWAGIQATKDYRMVLAWDPRVRAYAKICTGIGVTVFVVDVGIFIYLMVWQGIHDEPSDFVGYIATQQILFFLFEGYMVFILWSYYWRLRLYKPVMPGQENLPPPSITANAYPTKNNFPSSVISESKCKDKAEPTVADKMPYSIPTMLTPRRGSIELTEAGKPRPLQLQPLEQYSMEAEEISNSGKWRSKVSHGGSGNLTDIEIVLSPSMVTNSDTDPEDSARGDPLDHQDEQTTHRDYKEA